MGQETDVVYVREQKEISQEGRGLKYGADIPTSNGGVVPWSMHVIGFCGKTYTCVEIEGETGAFCYSIEDMDRCLKERLKEREWEKWSVPKKAWSRGKAYCRRMEFENYFDPASVRFDTYNYVQRTFRESTEHVGLKRIFEEHQVPIFVRSWHSNSEKLVLNPKLADYNFAKVFDPYRAFQELSMYIGNTARPEKPIPEISNRDMVGIKGFDEWSFRKPPSKK